MRRPIVVAAELEEHRPYLLKFAALQLKQKDLAEDVVQEVFLSALKAGTVSPARSSVRTWLTSILLNKIADHHRKAGREISMDALSEADGEDAIDALFRKNGHYADMVLHGSRPPPGAPSCCAS